MALYPTLSAWDNLAFFGRVYGLRGTALKERIAAVLDLVGLRDRAGDAVRTFSGGMKRRLNIAAGLTVMVLLTMSALGGCFVPRFIMPDWLKTIGLVTPHAWALDAYQDLLVRGYGLVEVLPKVGALAVFAVAFFGIGVWRFRFE